MERSLSVDVHGMTSAEAKRKVNSLLCEYHKRGYPELCIIHGNGSGILKKEIRTFLLSSMYVRTFRAGKYGEGGDGITIAKIR